MASAFTAAITLRNSMQCRGFLLLRRSVTLFQLAGGSTNLMERGANRVADATCHRMVCAGDARVARRGTCASICGCESVYLRV